MAWIRGRRKEVLDPNGGLVGGRPADVAGDDGRGLAGGNGGTVEGEPAAEPTKVDDWFLALKRELHQQVIASMNIASIGTMTEEDLRLVAYLVSRTGDKLALSDLQRLLREKLPDYMIPSAFVSMEALPRRALMQSSGERGRARVDARAGSVCPGYWRSSAGNRISASR